MFYLSKIQGHFRAYADDGKYTFSLNYFTPLHWLSQKFLVKTINYL